MKPKPFINWSLAIFSLILLAGCSADATQDSNENYGELNIPIETVSLDDTAEDFSYYNLSVQDELQQQVNALKEKQDYTFKEPLLIINPYGTNTTGLYLYFEENPGSLSYTISAEGTSDFTRTAKDANSIENRAEYQLIGLVPGMENRIALTYTYENGLTKTYEFTLDAPAIQSGYPPIKKTEGAAEAKLSAGLFYTLGTDGYAGYSYVFDNDGTLRAEIVTEDYRTDRMEFYKGSIVTAISDSQLARIDRLGKVVAVYNLEGFHMHHDFALSNRGQLLILATDESKESIEDVVLSLDLETGKYEKLIDFDSLMGSYKEMTEAGKGDLNWIHFNSIDLAGDDTMLLSSRETSTIIQISGIYDEPAIDYLLGNESVWADTEFADKSLSKAGDFEYQSGQHTATYMDDASLLDGQYYVYMFQNNYWRYTSRPDYEGLTNTKASLTWEPNNKDISKFYKYLVDEYAGTYHLVQEFAVPYSSIVSSTQIYGDSIIVNSGMAKTVGEYDANGNLLAQFSYDAGLFTYRIFKDTFKGFWFE
ncbi:aryl-sulfate sulfotransferase [Planococcus sp. N028]|uniref:Aryl-sulfate sulfotransferase n=1 Tax=Planococcus shixiaomingii TaxID=3058393 RepID=A0ABT8N163_9BACL|nr:aryl-sulfate sulfotransferase [Planococcus sp. N028]MDN7241637.1 aryl-sulfate sulfotransferase [Planococcus sp. N028]